MRILNGLKKVRRRGSNIGFFGHFGSPNFGNEITLQTLTPSDRTKGSGH